MTLGAVHRWSLTSCCALAALGTVSGSTVLALSAALLTATMLATGHQLHDVKRSPLRTWLVHGFTILVLVWALSVARRARIDSVVVIVYLGLFNRFVLRQGLRDDLILLGGAAVLLAVSTTITPGIAFLPIFVGFVWFSFGALRSAQIIGLAETEPPHQREIARRALLRRKAPGGQAKLAVIAMVFTALGYVGLTLFPKHHFARLLGAGAFMSLPGASDVMTLTNNGINSVNDGTVVLRVTRMPGSETSLQGLYARVYALDQFDGRQWSREPNAALYPLFPDTAAEADPNSKGRVKLGLHRITRVSGAHPLVAIGRGGPARLLWVDHRARISVDGTWHLPVPASTLSFGYGADLGASQPQAELPIHAERLMRKRWLELPETLPKPIRDLGLRLTENATTSADKVRAVLAHFNAGYQYSLEPLSGDADDPLTRFLFEAKRGHCELYAGAVATLLRVGGVPARVVTGYYGGWWNSTGQALEFTEQDAHAWVEAYDVERGWLWVDATPPSLRARRRGKAWAFIRDFYDTLEALWFNNVVDFDEKKRKALIGRLLPQGWLSAAGGGAGGGLNLGLRGPGAKRSAGILVLGAGAFMLLGLVGWWLSSRRSKALGDRLRGALDPDADPAVPLGRLVMAVPADVRNEADRVVRAYEQWRFGTPASTAGKPPADLRTAVIELERTVAAVRRRAP